MRGTLRMVVFFNLEFMWPIVALKKFGPIGATIGPDVKMI
jgi:hypothetical protein